MFDINILRHQFIFRLANWKRTVTRIRFNNIQGREYFHEGEDDQQKQNDIDIFITTQNSEHYTNSPEGKISNIIYHAFSTFDTDIQNNDFIKHNGFFFKVFAMSGIINPLTNELIAKEFDLIKIDIDDDPEEVE